MSEYLIQGETLTGIADKIRPLLGLTGTMTPEQMQTNLTTEQANITAALAALAEKGVEVPEGANSNALAGLIAAIEAGGGNFNSGTYTPGETVDKTIRFTHSLGEIPSLIVFFRESYTTSDTKNEAVVVLCFPEAQYSTKNLRGVFNGYAYTPVETPFIGMSSSATLGMVNNETMDIKNNAWVAGNTYRWMVFSGVNLT